MDTEYLKESMEGDLFEIEGGKIALRMSSNAAVRNLASALISDHQKSYADAVDLAHRFGVPVQTDPSPSEQWELQAIQQFSGAQFNHQYALLEVYDHMQDIDLATHEAADGCASSVRENARNELPMLERHLAHSKRALAANP
jgi:putative membrane protein